LRKVPITVAVVAALALPLSSPAGTTATKLAGTTGPGFTITVKKAGKRVTSLKAGSYTFTVADKSGAHDFVLVGPGLKKPRVITGLGFTGTKSATLTLKKGRYEYYCTPHRRMGMRGFITVS
jgi:plastocyanin